VSNDSPALERTFVTMASPVGYPAAPFGASPLQGVYVKPSGSRPTTAFIATHVNMDFTEHYLGPLLAARGYGFLGWNTRFRGAEQLFLLDHAVAEIGAGVRWLYEHAGVERVVLIGNSGGGALMAAYQAQALDPYLEPVHGGYLTGAVEDLLPADLYISIASHPGRTDMALSFIDPSVLDETDPISVDPELDMYNPDNGPPYTPEFQARYRAGQLARNQRITTWVKAEMDRLAKSDRPAADRVFTVHRIWADLRFVDPAIDPSARQTPSCWLGDPRWANDSPYALGNICTLPTWLSMWSADDSQFSIRISGPHITTPALIVAADGDTGVFPSDTTLIAESIASTDKTAVTLTGDHYFQNPGARDELTDLLETWVTDRT
jgi:pimeloyl-ACP methyl ester carboxylesterase